MNYALRPATESDKQWLDTLRREAYRELFTATWGGWDEARHVRHFAESWGTGNISVVLVNDTPAGMMQVLESDEAIEIAEIQVLPSRQNLGLGSQLLVDVIASASRQGKPLRLHLGRQNHSALRLYERNGFTELGRSDTHIFMEHS